MKIMKAKDNNGFNKLIHLSHNVWSHWRL